MSNPKLKKQAQNYRPTTPWDDPADMMAKVRELAGIAKTGNNELVVEIDMIDGPKFSHSLGMEPEWIVRGLDQEFAQYVIESLADCIEPDWDDQTEVFVEGSDDRGLPTPMVRVTLLKGDPHAVERFDVPPMMRVFREEMGLAPVERIFQAVWTPEDEPWDGNEPIDQPLYPKHPNNH